MSKKLQKSLQDYLTKIKSNSPNIQFPSKPVSCSKKWILKGCRHPKTLSFAVNPAQETNNNNGDDAATLADVDRFLFENFRSLYIEDDDEIKERRRSVRSEDHEDDRPVRSSGGFLPDPPSPRFMDLPSYHCGSNRFFVSTGSSSSLVDEARSCAETNTTVSIWGNMDSTSTSSASINKATANSDDSNSNAGVEGDGGVTVESSSNIRNQCIAVLKYSPNSHDDFLRSMQEMVEARLKHHSKIDWGFMEELVFCYLNLNDKKSHKFILSAFVDLVTDLRQKDTKIAVNSRRIQVNNARFHNKSRRTRHHVR